MLCCVMLKIMNLLLLAVILYQLIGINCTPIDYQKVTDCAGVTVLEVLDENKLKLSNHYRLNFEKPQLKFSINGAKILTIKALNCTAWQLQLSDSTVVEMNFENRTEATEYYFLWHGGGPNDQREVCFHYGYTNASWYSTYQSAHQKWPMDTSRVTPNRNFNYLFDYDWANEAGEFLYILEHLFVNSDGFAVLLDEHQPLFIRRDDNHGNPQMCFSVNNVYPYAAHIQDSSYKDIRIRLFASSNIRTVTDYVVHSSGHIPKPTELPDVNKFVYPSFFGIPDQVLQFVDKLEQHGLVHAELVKFFFQWSAGDSTLNGTKFPNSDAVISTTLSKGFRFGIELYPNLVTDHEPTRKYFLTDQSGKPTQMLDFSLNSTTDWYSGLLRKLKYEDDIWSFLVISPNLAHLRMHNPKYPNEYVKNFVNTVSNVANVTTYAAFKSQHLPLFVQMQNHYQENVSLVLQRIIPDVLSVSIAGYSFIFPVAVGSTLYNSPSNEELFIRWLQINALMPGMSFYYLHYPFDHSQKTLNMMKKFVNFHIEHSSVIIDLAKKRISHGTPIVRPMWYIAPDDVKTYRIDDQFMLGDDILVAPVVLVGQRERTVYLPSGTWIDQHGATFDGPGEIKVAAPLEELPYFKRKL